MRIHGYPLYQLLLSMIAGIVLAYFRSVNSEVLLISMIACFVLAASLLFLANRSKWANLIFGFSALCFFFLLGQWSYHSKTELPDQHYLHAHVMGETALLQLELTDRLASNAYNDRFYAEVSSVNEKKTCGKVLVLFKKKEAAHFDLGDQIIAWDDIHAVSDARNPGDFKYKDYLANIDVYGQVYLDLPHVISYQSRVEDHSPLLTFRESVLQKLEKSSLSQVAVGLVEALILGQRQHVDPGVAKSFRDAGVIHILALSGLHVGILLLLLKFLTSGLTRLRYGRWIQSILIISVLWLFAMLTGLSPSILRAVTMFSAVAIGMNIKRKSSVFHSLAISAFVLLVYDPRLLFQVGFQLSYTAVISIVLIQPVLAGLWRVNFKGVFGKLHAYLWNICTVSLAAQIGVAPLGIYYFHQFPGLFLISNLFILPLLPFILVGCLLLVLLLVIGWPSHWLEFVLDQLLLWVVGMVNSISSVRTYVFQDLYLSAWELILIYLFVFGIVLFLLPYFKRSRRERFYLKSPNWMMHVALLALILWIGGKTYEFAVGRSNGISVLHQARGTAIALYEGNQAILFTDLHQMDSLRRDQSINRLKQASFFVGRTVSSKGLENLIGYQGKTILVIDESAVYDPEGIVDVVLLSHSPRINLARVLKELKPTLVIADASNFKYLVDVWEETCRQNGVEFRNTYTSGAVPLFASE
ncbi:ComEC/Rec2 family competence protein [Nonlabens xiamenensis]|uniref:ComEC/Rec2 family competence protein n=1 Tax=Nonlabens xiamenensis TaxID=2341043 RepID=UPI000F60CF5E|nr:ComEC/Rec2 family competence protein [Nonlabens xiamenensis]